MSKNHAKNRNPSFRISRSFVSDGSRFPLLDLIRIVAALSIFLYHFGIGSKNQDSWRTFKFGSLTPSWNNNHFLSIWSQYGYLGVDVFFFLSGFVISRTMTGKGPNEFLLARFKRLFLPYFLVFIPTFIVYYSFSIKPPLTDSSILDVAFSAQWKGLQPIIAASWTLVYEINFYLIVFIFMAIREILRKLGIDFHPHTFFIGLLILSSVSKLKNYPTPFSILFFGGYSILFVGGALTYFIISSAFRMNFVLKFWLVLFLTSQILIHLKARIPNDQNATKISIIVTSSMFLIIVITGC